MSTNDSLNLIRQKWFNSVRSEWSVRSEAVRSVRLRWFAKVVGVVDSVRHSSTLAEWSPRVVTRSKQQALLKPRNRLAEPRSSRAEDFTRRIRHTTNEVPYRHKKTGVAPVFHLSLITMVMTSFSTSVTSTEQFFKSDLNLVYCFSVAVGATLSNIVFSLFAIFRTFKPDIVA